jgi:hypothetical protein
LFIGGFNPFHLSARTQPSAPGLHSSCASFGWNRRFGKRRSVVFASKQIGAAVSKKDVSDFGLLKIEFVSSPLWNLPSAQQ